MPHLNDILGPAIGEQLTSEDAVWLHKLVSDWQVIADLSSADLLMWVPVQAGRFVAAAHCRPATGATVHIDDVIGRHLPGTRAGALLEAMETGAIVTPLDTRWAGTYAISERLIPVVHNGRTIAVLALQSASGAANAMSLLQRWQMAAAEILCNMVAAGTFPAEDSPGSKRGGPRVPDGAVHIDADGVVLHASPNAISAFTRLGLPGNLVGETLAEKVTEALEEHTTVEETLAVVLMGRASWRTEVEVHGTHLAMRAIPLSRNKERLGAIILVRDITEIRYRELELMTKDATIREIHHRVKNNLQTVSALLRLQARRSQFPEVKEALEEAERRVSMIAMVHEALSQSADSSLNFDEVAGKVVRMASAVASSHNYVRATVEGTFGEVDSDVASTLAVVLSELVSNSVEHGFGEVDGEILVTSERSGDDLVIHVLDNGVGIADGAALSGLGTRIVKTLVRGELRGTIDWGARPGGGTDVTIRAHARGANVKRERYE
ncbi:histidine kinase N-terminal domain-containing protein [Buchananella felis]|uniref:sensor histidine kinase n=1 Tax=Buchananella felis TaxID=3231492 RepID=UPI003529516D